MDEAVKEAKAKAIERATVAFDHVSRGTQLPFSRVLAAAIGAYEASLAESGLVLVPRKPTEAMLDAAVAALERHTSETEYSTPLAVYRAMLAATSPPQPHSQTSQPDNGRDD